MYTVMVSGQLYPESIGTSQREIFHMLIVNMDSGIPHRCSHGGPAIADNSTFNKLNSAQWDDTHRLLFHVTNGFGLPTVIVESRVLSNPAASLDNDKGSLSPPFVRRDLRICMFSTTII